MTGHGWRRQIAECLVLPMLAVSLPWPALWRILRWFASRGRLFRAETERAQAMATREGFVKDARLWAMGHRLTRLVDQIDPALSFMRGDAWMDRHLSVRGDPLPVGPCILAGFHYGTGFWSLRYLRRHGHPVAFLSRPLVSTDFPGEPLRYAFERWRMNRAAAAGGAPVIYVGGSIEKMRQALRGGTSILGMVDVPQPSSRSRVQATFFGAQAWFPDGLLRLADSEGVPLIAYVAGLDSQFGRRRLTLTRVPIGGDGAMRMLSDLLERAIRDESAAWHLWADWPLFFENVASH